MSKRGFASKSMFEVLAVEDVDDVEEDDEVVDEPVETAAPESSAAQAETLSRSARKRAAKLARKVSETATPVADAAKDTASQAADAAHGAAAPVADTVERIVETSREKATQAVETVKEAAPQVVDAAKQVAQSATTTATQAVESASSSATSAAASAKEAVEDAIDTADFKAPNGDVKATNGHRAPETRAAESVATVKAVVDGTLDMLPSVPATSSFAPALPASLPHPTANALPANRKRKTPTDFSPSGPNDAPTQNSSSKLGVKFEDGVGPGEGRDGEKTIKPKKHQNVIERTTWTFIMIFGFITLLCLGHPYMILLVMLCQTLVYKEVTALFELRDHGSQKITPAPGEKGDSWSKTLNWYFFVVTNYFLYGESIIYYFKHIVFVDAYFLPFAKNHRFISFMLYVVGFVGFVANLQRQYLRQQFALFCWVHITLLLIVVSSHFIVNNILEGLIWFFVPASLVICNDVMAYVCGKLFGRTPLIKLSPKKTVEGFLGAFICTLIFGLAWGTFFMRFPYMICPARDLGTTAFSTITCKPNPVFVWRDFAISGPAAQLFKALGREPPTISYAPFQLHVLVMATFASLVAPFGGFFASGFKRAFNIKDFGHSIPGHGGMTDRMDCQFMMGLFSYVYYSSLIRIQYVTVGSIMQTIVTSLSTSEQLELYADVRRFLDGQGVKVK
ncbi:phosphatidate cytidylyltransferase [Cryptotrichosporon argae]